uniref:Zinc-binding protein A33-like n=1 Tax=Cynoglossus semilaevis TaxID=244447 RepID=A0A3P8ULI3_CYNSE
MAAGSTNMKPEDPVLCAICLTAFTDLVSTPCGHNFCKNCIVSHWTTSIHIQVNCPMCKEVFNTRPQMEINSLISEVSKLEADTEKEKGVQVFSALKEYVNRGLTRLLREIEDKQKAVEGKAEYVITELGEEISELMNRSSEEEKLSLPEDCLHPHLHQSFSLLNDSPPTQDQTQVNVCSPTYEGTVVKAVAQLEETFCEQAKKKLKEVEIKKLQQFAVDVTFDPDTAHPALILSEDKKQVYCGDEKKHLPDNTKRFNPCVSVMGKQSFSSGRFYYEVQVKGKSAWDLGVARESINRKGNISMRPQDGYWTIILINGNEYFALSKPSARLCLTSAPEKVGVFVDYDKGLVSFYDVDAVALIYSFTDCSFTEKLHPFFSPCVSEDGKNSAPLIIGDIQSQAVDFYRAVSPAKSFHPKLLLEWQ